jgi:hypothetical protein
LYEYNSDPEQNLKSLHQRLLKNEELLVNASVRKKRKLLKHKVINLEFDKKLLKLQESLDEMKATTFEDTTLPVKSFALSAHSEELLSKLDDKSPGLNKMSDVDDLSED